MALAEFMKTRGLRIRAVEVDDWPWPLPKGRAWSVTLTYKGRSMLTRIYSYTRQLVPPKPEDVLIALLWDRFSAASAPNYESWCALMGYKDSPRARKNYEATCRISTDVACLLGEDMRQFADVAGF